MKTARVMPSPRGRSDKILRLSDVRNALADSSSRRSILTVPTAELRLGDDGRLHVNGQTFGLSVGARDVLAKRASIPITFFRECAPDVQRFLFDRFFMPSRGEKESDEQMRLIVEDGQNVHAILNPKLALLSAEEVLGIAVTQRPPEVDESTLYVPSFALNGHLRVSIVTPSISAEPRVGDVVHGGIDVLHSDSADCGTQVTSYLMRLACRNGMLIKVCQHGSSIPSRVRRATDNNRELTRTRIAEMANKAWRELDAKLRAVQVLAEHHIPNPAQVLASLGEKLRFPARLVREVLKAIDDDELGRTDTAWDLVNALARLGTHNPRLGEATQRFLQELSGDLIHEQMPQCPSCGQLMPRRSRFLPRR